MLDHAGWVSFKSTDTLNRQAHSSFRMSDTRTDLDMGYIFENSDTLLDTTRHISDVRITLASVSPSSTAPLKLSVRN